MDYDEFIGCSFMDKEIREEEKIEYRRNETIVINISQKMVIEKI